MKKLLEFLIKEIVQYPDQVKIEEEEQEGLTNFKVQAHPEDLKIIIGKTGRTINSLRHLLRIKPSKIAQKITIEIVQPA